MSLFVGCAGGISIFDEKSGEFHKLGDYVLGKGTHTIAIDEQTQEIFLPQITGGRPILRIGRYNPNRSVEDCTLMAFDVLLQANSNYSFSIFKVVEEAMFG